MARKESAFRPVKLPEPFDLDLSGFLKTFQLGAPRMIYGSLQAAF